VKSVPRGKAIWNAKWRVCVSSTDALVVIIIGRL